MQRCHFAAQNLSFASDHSIDGYLEREWGGGGVFFERIACTYYSFNNMAEEVAGEIYNGFSVLVSNRRTTKYAGSYRSNALHCVNTLRCMRGK